MRRRPGFTSALHGERVAAVLGIALGVSFTVCFVTGLLSHVAQDPHGWFAWPARPAGLYRVTQGVHVATGLASIPLLLAKLWTVYPRLFRSPVFGSVASAVERISVVPLVGGALFLLSTGVANVNLWYPWPFNFRTAHYWVAWITIGALVVHVGAKFAVTRRTLGRGAGSAGVATAPVAPDAPDALGRRGFLALVGGAAVGVTALTVGQTVWPLRKLALLAPRRPDTGPQGFPVNRSARAAGVETAAVDPGYRLLVDGRVDTPLRLALDEVRALPQHEATLPIACVDGWSASRTWSGVRVRDLLAMAGARPGASVRVDSLQRRFSYSSSLLNADQAADADTLLALRVEGETLHLDHGYPVRLIGPNRPGVEQTKWVTRLTVL
ncbi:MAG TPA: molybdopterin-dependent oxidoreductase [Acidimicrobiia bacterium]|nr:molybdopterin-dependent oxidoreductase [Acidimicrobiia bacterium]